MQFLFFCFLKDETGMWAVDVNRPVHSVVRDCGIVHGEREIVRFAIEHPAGGESKRLIFRSASGRNSM
jgi:hypothetical protein